MNAIRHSRLAICAIVLAVVGCAGPTSTTSPGTSGQPSGPATSGGAAASIRWGIYADPARLEVAESQAAAFKASNPNITVEVAAVPFGDYYDKLGTQIASGTAYDVMIMSPAYFPKIAPQGGLADLTELIKRDNLDLSQYTTEVPNSVFEGKTMALPYELDIQALFYNKDLFDAAGVEYPTDDWTWEDLRAAAVKLTTTKDGKTTWGFLSDNLYPSWASFIGQAGGSILGPDGATATIDTPEVREALTFMTDLIYKDKVSPAPGQLPEGTNAFHSGLAAMVVDGSYSVLPTIQNVKFKWDVAPLPDGKKEAVAYWTQGIAVYNKTPQPDAAWAFAKYLMSPEGQQILAKSKFATPSLRSAASSSDYLTPPPDSMNVFNDEFPSAVTVGFNDKWFDIMPGPNSSMGQPFSLLWLNKLSVDEAVKQAQEATEKVLGN